MIRLAAAALVVLLASAPLHAAPAPRPKPAAVPGAPGSATNFSGLWEIDPTDSAGGATNLEKAVLQVTQKGERIWIQPLGDSRKTLLADEVVVDGRSYEKALGGNKRGTLTAKWGTDAKSLWLEVVAGTDENPRAAVQRSVWKLSDDRNTWVRETVTMTDGRSRRSRLVFHRHVPEKTTPNPKATPAR